MPENVLTIGIDGTNLTVDDLTFKERKQMRTLALEIGEETSLDEVMVDDLLIALVVIAKRRTSPGFTVDAAMELKPGDITPTPLVKTARKKTAST